MMSSCRTRNHEDFFSSDNLIYGLMVGLVIHGVVQFTIPNVPLSHAAEGMG